MKGILIDPFRKTVIVVDVESGIEAIYNAIQADTFAVISMKDTKDAAYLDDDGLFKENQEFFAFGNYPHPLGGRALILGTNDEGRSVDAKSSLAEVFTAVRWLTPSEAVAMNRKAVAYMHQEAAGKDNVIVSAPLLSIDPITGKARAS